MTTSMHVCITTKKNINPHSVCEGLTLVIQRGGVNIKKNVFFEIVFIFLFGCIVAIIFAQGTEDSMDGREWAEAVHVVESGETLWDISQIYCPEDVDRRDWIDRVTDLNGIDGYIYPGDELVILVVE